MGTRVEGLLTWRDFAALDVEDDLRRELIDGRVVVSPAPIRRHQRVVAALLARLWDWGGPRGVEVLAGGGVLVDDHTELIPDILAALPATRAAADDRHYDLPPELVVEVSSPTTRHLDLGRKRQRYAHAGVATYWFIDLDAEQVLVHHLDTDRHLPRAAHHRSWGHAAVDRPRRLQHRRQRPPGRPRRSLTGGRAWMG